jgi:hypothetical protein
MIYPDDIELLRTQFTKEILQDVLSRRPTFTLNYRLMLEGEPTWVSLKACRMSKGDRKHIVIGVSSIDPYMKRLEEFERAQEENVTFGGRLGEYRYYDMDAVIAAALRKSDELLKAE